MKSFSLVFYVVLIFTTSLHGQNHDVSTAEFGRADSIAELYPRHSLKDLRLLSNKLTRSLSTEAGKFRAIYKWVCINIDNDYSLYQKNKAKRENLSGEKLIAWNKEFNPKVFKILMEHHKTVCTGYAYLIRELALHAGLSCRIVDGYGRTSQANVGGLGIPNHSWNAVQLGGKWYLCDPTWSSGSLNLETSDFVNKFDDSYFLADPSFFIRNHYPLDSTWMLLDHKPKLKSFLEGPLIYVSAYRYKVQPEFPESFNIIATKGETVSFRFKKNGGKAAEKVELKIKDFSTDDKVVSQVNPDQTLLYSIDHIFSRRGTYAIHLLMDDQYVLTYQVKIN